MTGTMADLWLAAAVFLATHFGLARRPVRGPVSRAIGDKPFIVVYSLISLVTIWWLVAAYNAVPRAPQLWWLGGGGAYIAIVLMPLAFLLLVAGLTAPNPTAVGAEKMLSHEVEARGVLRLTRNPVLWSFGLWALAHLASNGDLPSVILFGSLGVLAILGSWTIEAKKREENPVAFDRFREQTSNVPLAAVIQGRQSLTRAVREIGWWRLGLALLLYGGLLHGHASLFGVRPYPTM